MSEADQGEKPQTRPQKTNLKTESTHDGNEQHSLQHFLSRHTLILNRAPKYRIIPEQTTAEVRDKYNIHGYLPQYVYMNSYSILYIDIYIFTNRYRCVYLRLTGPL